MEFTLLWAALTAFLAALVTIRITKPRVPDRPLDRLVGAALVGMAAGRIGALLMQGTNPITHPGEFFVIRGGVDTVWASLAAVATLTWSLKKSPAALDAVAPAALASLAGWHGGCVWRSTCLGTMSDLPWAWPLPGSDLTRHPVEIYAALMFALGAWWVNRIKEPVGMAAATAVFIAGLARLVTEPMRLRLGAGLWWFYASAVAAGLLLVGFIALRARRPVSKGPANPYPPGG